MAGDAIKAIDVVVIARERMAGVLLRAAIAHAHPPRPADGAGREKSDLRWARSDCCARSH